MSLRKSLQPDAVHLEEYIRNLSQKNEDVLSDKLINTDFLQFTTINFQVKLMCKCLQPAFFCMASLCFLKMWLHRSLWGNDPAAYLIYDLTKEFFDECVVSKKVLFNGI